MDSQNDRPAPAGGTRRWFLNAVGLGASAYIAAEAVGVARADVAPPAHTDIPHNDVPHTDITSTDHLDTPHVDNKIPHQDIAHLDSVGPPHIDTGHIDSTHQDVPHGDIPKGHTDTPHTDVAHVDLKSVPPVDPVPPIGGGLLTRAEPARTVPDLNRWLSTVIS